MTRCPKCGARWALSPSAEGAKEVYCAGCGTYVEPQHASLYLIWSHEHRAWWRAPGVGGYTQSLADAGRFLRHVALRICARTLPYHGHGLPELPVRLEDVEAFVRAFDERIPHEKTEAWR